MNFDEEERCFGIGWLKIAVEALFCLFDRNTLKGIVRVDFQTNQTEKLS